MAYRGLFDHFANQHAEVENTEPGHEAKLSHELIAAAGRLLGCMLFTHKCLLSICMISFSFLRSCQGIQQAL